MQPYTILCAIYCCLILFTMTSGLGNNSKSNPDTVMGAEYIDFNSLQQVPEAYNWTELEENRGSSTKTDTSIGEPIPVIDLSDPNAPEKLGHACKNWGVFHVINHGVPLALLDTIESASDSIFSLPIDQKLKAERSVGGINGYGRIKISYFFDKLMWSEGFTIVGSPLEHFRKLWPQDYAKFCNIFEDYQKEMRSLAGRLMWLVMGQLGLTKEDLKWAGLKGDFPDASAVFQLNYYPACPNPDKAMGLVPHTDSSLLTILKSNNSIGLEVFKEGNGWVSVPPVPGGLTVNVGDLLTILSNGLYTNVRHRVMVNQNNYRLSMVYLYGPPSDAVIAPASKLVGPDQPPLYHGVTWNNLRAEYIGLRAKNSNGAELFHL